MKNIQEWNLYALVDLIFDKDVVQLVSTLMSIQFGLGRREKNWIWSQVRMCDVTTELAEELTS